MSEAAPKLDIFAQLTLLGTITFNLAAVLPHKYHITVKDKLLTYYLEAVRIARQANTIALADKNFYQRPQDQRRALALLEQIEMMLTILGETTVLTKDCQQKIKEWKGQSDRCKTMIKHWLKSDRDRRASLLVTKT
jgi:uncharacterized protein YbaP (TraB family)